MESKSFNFKRLIITSIATITLIISGLLIHVKAAENQVNLGDENTMSIAWYQTSAEVKALYLQGYNIAHKNVDQSLHQNSTKPRAVILDIDETVLDNSPYQAYSSLYNKSYPNGWNQWVNAAEAKTVPGAKDFLTYAQNKGIKIYYVSNRDTSQLKATKKNLNKEGLPQTENSHILLNNKKDNSKEARFKQVAHKNNVIMQVGDSLTDFNDPKAPTTQARYKDVMKNANQFGSKYIILPNPMYGGWEGALYNNNQKLSDQQKSKARKAQLTYFDPKTNKINHTTTTEQ